MQHIGNFIWFHLLPFAWYDYNSIHLLSNVVRIHVLLLYWHVSCVYSHMYTSTVHTNSYNRLHSLGFLVFKLKTMTIQTFKPHIRFEKEEITMWGRGHFLKKKKYLLQVQQGMGRRQTRKDCVSRFNILFSKTQIKRVLWEEKRGITL